MPTINIDLLVVAGGGGGGSSTAGAAGGGGGGAGGFRYFSAITIDAAAAYTVTVGAGGNGSFSANLSIPTAGGNTTAFSYTANGGGYGGTNVTSLDSGGAGGSGGGGSGNSPTPGSAIATTPAQGFVGGGGGAGTAGQQGAGGGGGAGGPGAPRVTSISGAGGVGNLWTAGGTVFTGNYAGGGGGGASNSGGVIRPGGDGGGGDGGQYGLPTSAKSGRPNTGGGGGGGGADPTNLNYGGRGGSGIVLFRYAGTANLTNLSNVNIAFGYVYHAVTTSTVVRFYTDIGRGGVGGPYGGGGGGANGWINSIGGGGGAAGSALLTGNTGGYGGGGGGGSSATVASGGGGGVDIWGLGAGGAGGAANANGSGGSGNLVLNTTSLGGLPGFNGNGGLFGGGGSGGAVASVDTTRGWGAGGAFVILYSTSTADSYNYPNPSPVSTYSSITGAMLDSNASSLSQGSVTRNINYDSGSLLDVSTKLTNGYTAQTAFSSGFPFYDQTTATVVGQTADDTTGTSGVIGLQFPYYDLLATTNTTNTANYSEPTTLNQSVNFEFARQTASVQRYFVPFSANVNSVTNNRSPQQTVIINLQPEFMLVNSDKLFVASNVNPTNYQTIQAVTTDNDPRLASLKVGYIVKGQTGANPYNPQNIY